MMRKTLIREDEGFRSSSVNRRRIVPLTIGLAVIVAAQLTGCAASQGVRLAGSVVSVNDSEALITPSAGGPSIVGVVERRYSNAIEQEIALFTSSSTAGQNVLRIQMYGPMEAQLDQQKKLPYKPISPFDLRREMRQALPGIAMRTSGLFLQNGYGPFGYAFGRSPSGDSCVYAWQQLRANDAERDRFRNMGMIQVRLRLCDGQKSEKDLLWSMYNFTINGMFAAPGWNPYGEPSSVDPGIGRDGNPVYPKDVELSQPVARSDRSVARPVNAETVVRPKRSSNKTNTENRTALEVPSPSTEINDTEQKSANATRVVVPAPVCLEGTVCD